MPPVSRPVGKLLICDDVTPFDSAVTSATSFHGESASKVIELTTSANLKFQTKPMKLVIQTSAFLNSDLFWHCLN